MILPPPPYATDQWAFTSLYEGVVPHMYLDSLGNVTCACGELIPNEQAALRLPWSPDAAGAVLDYYLVKEAPRGHVASWYRNITKSRLPDAVMRGMFIQRVAAFRKELAQKGWHLERVPLPGQIAVVDMAYNLGVGGPGKGGLDGDFPSFKTAILAANYARAADECHRRPPVSRARNEATRVQLLACVG